MHVGPRVITSYSIHYTKLYDRAQRAQQDAGGKGINVASCLADYAVPVAVTGQLGQENPALFEALFEARNNFV